MAIVTNSDTHAESVIDDGQGGMVSLHGQERADVALQLLTAELNESELAQIKSWINWMRKA